MKFMFLFVITICLYGCFGIEPEKTGLEGKPMPSFKILLTDSTRYFDTKDIPGGKPVVLLFIGPHCPYSKAQMAEIVEDINDLKNINFYVFTNWPLKEMKSFCNSYELKKYSNIMAGIDYSSFFPEYFGATGVPYIAIYGKDKKLNKAFKGRIFGKQILKIAEQ
jgi:thiol-disulfide isomerase/thioredoxin